MIIRVNVCHHCGYQWSQTSQDDTLPEKPKKCAKCKSTKWDVIWAVRPVKATSSQ